MSQLSNITIHPDLSFYQCHALWGSLNYFYRKHFASALWDTGENICQRIYFRRIFPIKLLKWLLFRLLQPNRHSFITAVFLWRSFFRSFMLSFLLPFLHFFICQLIHLDKKSFVRDLVLLIKFIFCCSYFTTPDLHRTVGC